MRVQVQLRIVTDDDTVLSEDVIACFDKGDDQLEEIGLSLDPAKTMLAGAQTSLVAAASFLARHRCCERCGRHLQSSCRLIFTRYSGSPAVCVDSSGEEDTATEQIEVGASVHLALDQLELVDLAFRLSAAPRHGKRRFDRRPILLQAGRESLDGRNTAGPGLLKPGSEDGARVGRNFVAVDTAVSHQLGEALDKGEGSANFGILSNPGERRGRWHIESFRRSNQQPGELPWRDQGKG